MPEKRDLVSTEGALPKHIAFIMDGNGRWAKKRLMPRTYGHREGVKSLKKIISRVSELNIPYATFYAFSTENWNRPEEEVTELMRLFDEQLDDLVNYQSENIRLRFIGDRSALDKKLSEKMGYYERETAGRTGTTACFAINYGGRDDIARCLRSLSLQLRDGFLRPEDISEGLISSLLDTGGIPDVDLLVRTGGEKRISNFLLWQLAYRELYFCDCLWPDFDESELELALESYSGRQRRFGRV